MAVIAREAGSIKMCSELGRWLQLPFGEFAKLIGNGTRKSQRDRPVSDRLPSEPITDHVNSAVCHPARHSSFGARTALLTFKPKRQLKLQVEVVLKMGHGDRKQRNDLLVR